MKTSTVLSTVKHVAVGYLIFVLVARAVGQASKVQV